MKTIYHIVICLFLGILLANCTGEKGEIGPKGTTGEQGARGDKGDAGKSGAFPVTKTGTFTINASDWQNNTVYTENDAFYAIVPVNAITKDVLDKSIVSVWWIFSNAQQVPLPFDRYANKILYAYYLENGQGRLRIDIYPSSNSAKATRPNNWTFRWIIN